MRYASALTMALALAGALSPARGANPPAHTAQIAVISALQPPRLKMTRDILRNVYLRKIFVDAAGQKLIPVNLPPQSVLRKAFSRAVLPLSEARLEDYWNRQYFQGVSPPYVLESQRAVVRFVATTPGAIGYVASCRVDGSVRVLMLLSLPSSDAAEANCADAATP